MTYPFLIRGPTKYARVKLIKIEAHGFRNALLKAFARYPVKYVNFKFARNMDLISAKAEAKKASMDGKTRYVASHKDGECTVEVDEPGKAGDVLHAVFVKGKEVKESIATPSKPAKRVSEQIMEEAEALEQSENKTSNKKQKPTMKTKKVVKKAAKKVAVKKPAKAEWGKVVSISIADMRAGIKKGKVYRDPQGVIQSEAYMKTRAKQNYVREGMYESKAA